MKLGSVFKNFHSCSFLNEGIVFTRNSCTKSSKKIKCAKFIIGEHDDKIPSTLSLKQILIRSSNIGTIKVARKMGENKLRKFLKELNILNKLDFELEEIGSAIKF